MSLIVFHRGGGKSLGYPPNCLLTVSWAVAAGARAIEYDVVYASSASQAEIFVVEPTLLKQHGIDINAIEIAAIASLDAGNKQYGTCPVARLDDVLAAVPDRSVAQQIHLKGGHPLTGEAVLSKTSGLKNAVFTSFDAQLLKALKQINPQVKIGWIVKPDNASGSEGAQDLTKMVSSPDAKLPPYGEQELQQVVKQAINASVDVVILCGPRVDSPKPVRALQNVGFQVGAWGVGSNLDVANRLIEFGIDRFTIDNPEQL